MAKAKIAEIGQKYVQNFSLLYEEILWSFFFLSPEE